ncbi:lipid A deacylase LpxR family protein [Marinobacter sp. F3R11]|nr:lipid A deacylase LpxR family protein [Marinobacter sp. F3R11]
MSGDATGGKSQCLFVFFLIRASLQALLLTVLLSACARADTFNISWDNDLLLGLDQGYTNGVRLSYLTSASSDAKSDSARVSRAVGEWFEAFPGVNPESQDQAVAFSLRQLMVTPADISREEPLLSDLPYAGYLALSSAVWSWDTETITGYGIHIGVVGPESGAAASQKWVHKLTGSEKPRGWDEQLGTDVVGGVQATHARKLWRSGSKGELENEIAWVGSATASSFLTSARVGAIWRLGKYLPVNFVPDYAGTSSTVGLPSALNDAGEGWSVFMGLGLEYIPYSYLKDNAAPYQFKESLLLGQAGIGATWQWQNLQAGLIIRATSGEEQSNKDSFSFGTLSLTWTY